MSRLEELRQEWMRRYHELVAPLLEPFGLSEQQRLHEKAAQLEVDLLRAQLGDEVPWKRSRRLRDWAWKVRMRGRMGR